MTKLAAEEAVDAAAIMRGAPINLGEAVPRTIGQPAATQGDR